MKLWVLLTPDEDGGYVVECPSLPGCVSQGETRDEALANIREAIALSILSRSELGMYIPPDATDLQPELFQVEIAA